MKLGNIVLPILLVCTLFGSPVAADPKPEFDRLQRLQPTNEQIEAVFSLFLGEVPSILREPQDRDVLNSLAPRVLQLLNDDQKSALDGLVPDRQVERIGSMSEAERTRFFFDAAQSLVHPSKQEWIRRMEDFTKRPQH